MTKTTKIKVIGSVVFATASLSLCLYSTYALFSDKKTGEIDIKTGDIIVSLEEDTPFTSKEQPVNGYPATTKTFRVASSGSKRTYTRVAIFPSIEYYDSETGEWAVFGALSNKDLSYTLTEETKTNWVEKDGYYYYTKVLNEGDKTTDFVIDDIQLGTVPIEYKDFSIRVNFYIEAEGIQATHQSYKINWSIDELPENVESVPSYNDDAELTYIPSFPDDPVADSSGHQIT